MDRVQLNSSGLTVEGNILPGTDDTYDLGSNSNRWRDLYLGPATLHIGTSTGDEGTLSYDTSTNSLIVKNAANSSSAFQVQNISGQAVFNVDTSGSGSMSLLTNASGELGSWSTNANALPGGRYAGPSVVANGYIYQVGGDSSGGAQSTVYYAKLNADGSTGTWSTNSNALPAVRQHHSVIVANGYIYVIGGRDASTALDLTTLLHLNLLSTTPN